MCLCGDSEGLGMERWDVVVRWHWGQGMGHGGLGGREVGMWQCW